MDYTKIFAILSILVIFFFFVWYKTTHIYVVSKIDGKSYKVKNTKLSQESADILATVNQRILKLKGYVEGLDKKPVYTRRLNKYDTGKISENVLNLGTTYTLNKKNMYFCLTPRQDDIYVYDINTLMFVAIHELAHISSESVGHTPEFIANFKDLVRHGIAAGVYEYVDYRKFPVEYCGMTIKNNVI